MARIIMLSSIAFMLTAGSSAQQKNGYTIHGYLQGLREGEKVIMCLSNNKGQGFFHNYITRQDSAYVKNGEFMISGTVPDGPRQYRMIFDKHNGDDLPSKEITLFIDNNEEITIRSADIDKIHHGGIEHYVEITGSPTNYSVMCLYPGEELYHQNIGRLNNYVRKIQDSIGFNGPLLDIVFACRDQVNIAYYYGYFRGEQDPEIARGNFFLPTDFGNFSRSGHAAFWKDFYDHLEPQKKNSFTGKWLKESTALCVGQPFPEFTLPMTDGKLLSIKEITGKSKITLVHFWATEAPSRVELEMGLPVMYKLYHDKGLNIVGVSTDKYLEEWNATLKSEQHPWYDVINAGGKLVEQLYNEYGGFRNERITNVLLDADGKIVAWDVKGPELQWYLWKIFGK